MTAPDPMLTGVSNFRDFGGRPSLHGGAVVRGRLFRSGHFNGATRADAMLLDGLAIGLLVDLRHPIERERAPNRWSPARTLARDPEPAAGEAGSDPGAYSAAVGRETMQATYRRIPHDPRFIPLFTEFFGALADDVGPVIVHCSAGKDRTGIVCALVLHALGVGRSDIFEDYLATNQSIDRLARAGHVRAELEPLHGPLDDEAIEPLIGVEAGYLLAALDTIEASNGSIDAYVEQVLGVTPPMLARMREHLLTGA